MNILLVTPVNPLFPDQLPLPQWQTQTSWRRALLKLGHKVKVFRVTDFPKIKWLKTLLLQRIIKNWQPDEVFFSAGKDALLPIKKTVFFSGVPFSMLSGNEQLIGLQAKLVVTNDPDHAQDWHSRGAKKAICLPVSAADPTFHHPTKPLKKHQADVVFIGGLLLDRQQLFLKLLKSGINLKLFGTLPENFLSPELKSVYFGPVWGKVIAQVYSSCPIALNPLPTHMPTGGNLRTFEIPACGAFQLASRTHPSWFISGKDIVLYKTTTDLIAKIRYYLTHHKDRRRIARAGYLRAHHYHTYFHRFKKLLSLL